jgi:two-component system cell cycle sensor histidine kinase/response regulator CckA
VNARDAMPNGGVLRVSTRVADADAMEQASLDSHRSAIVEVADTGKGIPPDLQDLVFEPFFTTKAPQGGTGLGLATCESIVQQHGGRISFDSSGDGTVFRVTLPLVERPTRRGEPVDIGGTRIGNGRVLLVEDEAAVRQVVGTVLRRHGYDVVDADEPLAARAFAATETFDVLVTDIVMPKLSGTALADEIAAIQPAVKVLFMSGYSHEIEHLREARERSGRRFIAKPFAPAELAMAVKELMSGPQAAESM